MITKVSYLVVPKKVGCDRGQHNTIIISLGCVTPYGLKGLKNQTIYFIPARICRNVRDYHKHQWEPLNVKMGTLLYC